MPDFGQMAILRERQVQSESIRVTRARPRPIAVIQLFQFHARKQPEAHSGRDRARSRLRLDTSKALLALQGLEQLLRKPAKEIKVLVASAMQRKASRSRLKERNTRHPLQCHLGRGSGPFEESVPKQRVRRDTPQANGVRPRGMKLGFWPVQSPKIRLGVIGRKAEGRVRIVELRTPDHAHGPLQQRGDQVSQAARRGRRAHALHRCQSRPRSSLLPRPDRQARGLKTSSCRINMDMAAMRRTWARCHPDDGARYATAWLCAGAHMRLGRT